MHADVEAKPNAYLAELLESDQIDRQKLSDQTASAMAAMKAESTESGSSTGSYMPLSSAANREYGSVLGQSWSGSKPVTDTLTIEEINRRDSERAHHVLNKLRSGEIRAPQDFYAAGMIFQHGDCSEDYRVANQFASIAMDAGYKPAKRLYALTLDRYLESRGKKQKFGTQYSVVDGDVVLDPVDPATTDAERAKYDVEPLESAKAAASEMFNN